MQFDGDSDCVGVLKPGSANQHGPSCKDVTISNEREWTAAWMMHGGIPCPFASDPRLMYQRTVVYVLTGYDKGRFVADVMTKLVYDTAIMKSIFATLRLSVRIRVTSSEPIAPVFGERLPDYVARLSSDTVAIQVKLPSQHTCRKLIDAQDYRGRFIIFETMYKETPEISFDSDTARMLIVSTLDTMFPNAIHKTC